MRHSCDPNSWLDGLNIVAKKRIKKGDEIFIEYATFFTEDNKDFQCRCQSENCRRIIKGSDYLKKFIGDKYINHMSEVVKSKRSN